MNLFENSSQRETTHIFIIPIVIGIIALFCLFSSELSQYNDFSEEYRNHSHTSSCEELICDKSEHTHSSACIDCGYSYYSSWHTHNSSCYCSKTEHAHSETCYKKICIYSNYSKAGDYANSRTSFGAQLLILIIILVLLAVNYWLTYNTSGLAANLYKKLEYYKDNFSDEKSEIWLKKLKLWIIIFFWLEIAAGIIFGIVDSTKSITPLGNALENYAFFVWAGAGTLFAFLSKNINMLVLQFLNNINDIRENTEKE